MQCHDKWEKNLIGIYIEDSFRKAVQGLFLNQHGSQQSMLVLSHENKTTHCMFQS